MNVDVALEVLAYIHVIRRDSRLRYGMMLRRNVLPDPPRPSCRNTFACYELPFDDIDKKRLLEWDIFILSKLQAPEPTTPYLYT